MSSARELRDAHAAPSDVRGALDGLATWGAIVLVVGAAHAAGHLLGYLAAAAVIGGLQHGLVNLAHEAWHRLCFRSRPLNDAVGAWLYSYPIGVPFHHDRSRHLRHHRLVGRSEDPDWPNYTNEGRSTSAQLCAYLLGRLFGSQLLATAKTVLIERRPRIAVETAPEEEAPGSRHELLRIAAVQLLLLALFAVFGHWWEYFVLWLGPVASFAAFFVAVRAFVEHAAPSDAVAAEARLHDFAPGRIERFFLSPFDFHLHALHHAYPNVPHFRLHALRHALDAEGHVYPGTREGGYLSVLRARLMRDGAAVAAGVPGPDGRP